MVYDFNWDNSLSDCRRTQSQFGRLTFGGVGNGGASRIARSAMEEVSNESSKILAVDSLKNCIYGFYGRMGTIGVANHFNIDGNSVARVD